MIVDGAPLDARSKERVNAVMDAIRESAGDDRPFRMMSQNDFPQKVGLGSSASGFAALAVAGAACYGLVATPERLSEFARLGAGSASRAVTGGISEWNVSGEVSFSRCLLTPEDLPDWRIVVPLVQHEVPTEGVHTEVQSSPLFQGRLDSMDATLSTMHAALTARDLSAIGAVAERDTLSLHAITMTSNSGRITWRPATIAVMEAVRQLRESGVPAHFSIDTGATAYINTDADHESQVADAVRDIDGVAEVLLLRPAGPAHLVDDHLF
jgi:phosphomevalonate decarboxylase